MLRFWVLLIPVLLLLFGLHKDRTGQPSFLCSSVLSLLFCGLGYKTEEGLVSRAGDIIAERDGNRNSKPQNAYSKWKGQGEDKT